jgi:hypothetical protein
VPTINATVKNTKYGLSISTQQVTTIQVQSSAIQLLIGGPYTRFGEEHTYGHVALRVVTPDDERVYDFGRYNGERGPFGQGRLRVWTKFSKYIASENSLGRVTTGFLYRVSVQSAGQVNAHFKNLIGTRPALKTSEDQTNGAYMSEYRLANDYHALNNNCATTSMDGARVAVKDLDFNVAKYNEGRGMSTSEQYGAKIAGWPPKIFMPADLQRMLEENPNRRPDKIERFGGKK